MTARHPSTWTERTKQVSPPPGPCMLAQAPLNVYSACFNHLPPPPPPLPPPHRPPHNPQSDDGLDSPAQAPQSDWRAGPRSASPRATPDQTEGWASVEQMSVGVCLGGVMLCLFAGKALSRR